MSCKFIDLFAGAGGLSCGLEQAGFSPVFANELIPLFAQTYQTNHPDTEIAACDIHELDRKALQRFSGIDLIAGGPPCQGFSVNAPERSVNDPRNHLFREFLNIVGELMPKAVLIENVPGIVSLGGGFAVQEIYRTLEGLGYSVGHRILFAGHYGVPQMRFRTIFIAMRNYDGEIIFPEPEYYAEAFANFWKSRELCYTVMPLDKYILKPKVTVWDAIGDLPEIKGGERISEYDYSLPALNEYQELMRGGSDKITSHFSPKLSAINLERLKHIPIGGSWRNIPYELLPAGLKRASRSDHTRRYGRLDPDGLCSTVMTKCDPHWGSFFHPYQERVISVREAARIQSFPDRYIFTGSMTEQYEQVGNAVPPLMAEAVAKCIYRMLEGKCRQ